MIKKRKNKENLLTSDEAIIFSIDPKKGLTDEDVAKRVESGLTNKIQKHVTKSYGKIVYDNLFNIFNILLYAIAIFMFVAGLEFPKYYAFLFVMFFNVSIGLYQDIKARKLVDKLKVVSYPLVNVIRNGELKSIQANKLVLSDVVVLKAGDQIACDGQILDGIIEVNESMLTGESASVQKNVGYSIYSGSYVVSGTAKYLVTKVGKNNYAESLQRKAKEFKKPKSEILVSINRIFRICVICVVVATILFIAIYTPQKRFVRSVSNGVLHKAGEEISWSLISMMPTGMYLLTSLTLAVGVIRLAKRRMLVQELYCIEMLARTDVICFDKTGTLTDGSMNLKEIICCGENKKGEIRQVLATLINSTNDSNSTAKAINNALKDEVLLDFHSGIPFNSERKYSAVNLTNGKSYILGAREFLPYDDGKITKICEDFEKQGLRVLLLCSSNRMTSHSENLSKVDVSAIVVLEDHIRDDAIENIAWFQNNDVSVRIISGDNPISVSAIAKRVGVNGADKFISLEGLTNDEVEEATKNYVVFGRVSPEQKEIIVRTLQSLKHTVAMTGDGVNDILALKIADCSIAMASGSDATKNVAHLVALDSNFSSLPAVVSEGRRVINNLQRTCSLYLCKTIFAATLTFIYLLIALASKGRFQIPFLTTHMYIWELITIGMASLFLSLQPNNERLSSTFIKNIVTHCIPGGILQLLIVGFVFLMGSVKPDLFSVDNSLISITVFCFSITSLIIAAKTSYPFDIYRGVLLGAMSLIIAGIFYIDAKILDNSVIGINYFAIKDLWWFVILVILAAIPLYLLIELVAKKILVAIDKRSGVKKHANK